MFRTGISANLQPPGSVAERAPSERWWTAQPDPAQEASRRLASLESSRHHLVRTVLCALAACKKSNSETTQLLLSAAVGDLKDLDDRLFETRYLKDTRLQISRQGKDMTFNSTIDPTEPFPENLRDLDDCALHVLNSKIQRELNVEYLRGAAEMETEFRRDELTEELNRRDPNGRTRGVSSAPFTMSRVV